MEVHTSTEMTHKLLTSMSGCLVDHMAHVLDEAIVGFTFFILVVEEVDDLQALVCPNVERLYWTSLCFFSCVVHIEVNAWVLLLNCLKFLSVGSTGISSEQFSCAPWSLINFLMSEGLL